MSNNKNITTNNNVLNTLDAYRKAVADGTVNSIPAFQLVALLNNEKEMEKCVGNESTKIVDQVDKNNKAENENACIDACKAFIAMERGEMFRVYSINPTYKGHKFSGKRNEKTNMYELTDCDMRIKFARLEKEYKTMMDDKNATLCRGVNYMDRVADFNRMLVEVICGNVGVNRPVLKDGYAEKLNACGLDCFTGKNNQNNRIACLNAIYSMILPENVSADAMKKDVAFILQTMSKAKGRTISTANDRDFMDLIIVTLGCALSFDGKKRTLSYEVVSKCGAFKSDKK